MEDSVEVTKIEEKPTSSVPARFTNAVRFYRIMESNSRKMYERIVWEGSAVAILRDMELPASYYQGIVGFLKGTSSVTLLKRGGGGVPSLWVLDHEPTYDEYLTFTNNSSVQNVKDKESKDTFLRVANELIIRVDTLEKELEILKRMFVRMMQKEDEK